MSQVQTSTFSVSLGDRAAYRAASEDVYDGRDTEPGRALLAEAQRELLAGKSQNQVQKELQRKGAGPGWAPRVVATASRDNWIAIMRRASVELDAGVTESPDLAQSFIQVRAMLSEDPRMSEARIRLSKLGASGQLIEFLCGNEATQVSQKEASHFTLNAGVAGIVIAAAMVALFFATKDVHWGDFALILGLISFGLIGMALAARRSE